MQPVDHCFDAPAAGARPGLEARCGWLAGASSAEGCVGACGPTWRWVEPPSNVCRPPVPAATRRKAPWRTSPEPRGLMPCPAPWVLTQNTKYKQAHHSAVQYGTVRYGNTHMSGRQSAPSRLMSTWPSVSMAGWNTWQRGMEARLSRGAEGDTPKRSSQKGRG